MEPWQVAFRVYWEARKNEDHHLAVVRMFASCIFDLEGRGFARTRRLDWTHPALRFKLAVDRWHQEADSTWERLAEILRTEWTDWALREKRPA